MRSILGLGAATLLLSAAAFGETWSGTVIDVMCKGKDPANHTRQCALGCAKGGFGLVTSDGNFVKFDEGGNEKTAVALKASKKEKDLRAKVTGSLEGDTIKVESIEVQ